MSAGEPLHLADVIEEEMAARGWDRDELAAQMCHRYRDDPDCPTTRLALDLFLDVREVNVVLGGMGEQFARAFDVSATFFQAIHDNWRRLAAAEARGAETERARVVADLRDWAATARDLDETEGPIVARTLEVTAARFERGDHVPTTGPKEQKESGDE